MSPVCEQLEVWEVVVPARPGATNSPELGNYLSHEWDLLPICIMRATFDDGSVGLGETPRGNSLNDLRPDFERVSGLRFGVFGPENVPDSWKPLGPFGGAVEEAHPAANWALETKLNFALETIALDAAGRRAGVRMVDLLGGAYREEVPVDYWCGRKSPKDLLAWVEEAVSRGFHGLKMKSRSGDPVLKQVEAIREAGGAEFSLTIDPMYQWFSPHEAISTLKSLEPHAHKLRIEDPFPEDRPEFWRRVRQTVAVPLAWHARGPLSLRRALQEGVADAFNCSGCARDFLTQAHAVEIAGYSCWRGSALELGISQVAGIHAAAAARNCVMASDFQSGIIRENTLIEWDWPYCDGHLPLPKGAGLGVELDMDSVDHYCVAKAVFG